MNNISTGNENLLFIVMIVQLFLMLLLIYFIYKNRSLLTQLKTRINEYIEKDMDNLKKVLNTSMENDIQLYDKQQFILNVLEEDGQIHTINNSKTDDQISLSPDLALESDNESWYNNIVAGKLFNKYLNTYNSSNDEIVDISKK